MGKMPELGLQFVADTINNDFTASFVTYIEFLGFECITKTSEDFISITNGFKINKDIIHACKLIRMAHKIKLPDAVIAATSDVYDLTIISRNTSDFKNIEGLTVLDPLKI
jgi:hypothetical protein